LHFFKLDEKTSPGPLLTSVILLFPLTHWPVVSKTYFFEEVRGSNPIQHKTKLVSFVFRLFEPCIALYLRNKKQQNAHFLQ
jgi:hypothetical protein